MGQWLLIYNFLSIKNMRRRWIKTLKYVQNERNDRKFMLWIITLHHDTYIALQWKLWFRFNEMLPNPSCVCTSAPVLRLVASDGCKIEIKLRLLLNAHKFVSTFPTSTYFSHVYFSILHFIWILLENYPNF